MTKPMIPRKFFYPKTLKKMESKGLLKQPSIQTEMGVNVHASAIGHLFMNKVKIFDGDGRSRDERESCFPMAEYAQEKSKYRGQVRDDG